MKVIGYLWAGLLILMGAAILSWIGYNYLVEMQPSAQGRNPIAPVVFSVAFILTGVWRLRRMRGRE